jgi:hypothetical protein
MSEQFIDTSSEEFIDAPKALRDAYDRLKSRYTEADKERETLKARVTQTALGDVLKDFKNPKRVQRDLASDGIDPLDSEAVSAWLTENGDDYAKGDGSTPSQTPAPNPEAAAHQRIAGADLSSPADMSKLEAAQAEITPDMTPEQVIQVFRKHGI